MAFLRILSWRANAACMAGASSSQSLVEPSMSVNRKVRVPVGGLATTLMSSLLPLRGHYSSGGFLGPSAHPSAWRRAAFAEHAHPPRANLCERVTDGTRTRALRSHNPPTSVATRCPTLQIPLIKAVFFAGGCPLFLGVAPSVVSEVVSTTFAVGVSFSHPKAPLTAPAGSTQRRTLETSLGCLRTKASPPLPTGIET